MTNSEKAMLILEKLDTKMNINWNLEKIYLDVIENALDDIDIQENEELRQQATNEYKDMGIEFKPITHKSDL